MTVESLRVTHRLRSRGDAAVWIAPRPDQSTATVLHFTADNGKAYAVELTHNDLTRIADTADDILAATPAVINAWLDGAARSMRDATVQHTSRGQT